MKGAPAVDKTVIRLIEKSFPSPKGVCISVPGDGEGDLCRLLAKKGYTVQAADFSTHDVKNRLFDAVILHGAVERCAFPEDIVIKVSCLLKKGGLLVITTFNGGNPSSGPPLFEEVWQREKGRPWPRPGPGRGKRPPLPVHPQKPQVHPDQRSAG